MQSGYLFCDANVLTRSQFRHMHCLICKRVLSQCSFMEMCKSADSEEYLKIIYWKCWYQEIRNKSIANFECNYAIDTIKTSLW